MTDLDVAVADFDGRFVQTPDDAAELFEYRPSRIDRQDPAGGGFDERFERDRSLEVLLDEVKVTGSADRFKDLLGGGARAVPSASRSFPVMSPSSGRTLIRFGCGESFERSSGSRRSRAEMRWWCT